ncbi:MAG: HAD hydrolase family protein [Bacteroidales bacterium]|nr:HAD hydrolase family protein [Bacteroidales bacterium]
MAQWKDIKVLALDVDGVMTRGELLALEDGTLLRTYNCKDTFAIRMATMKGLPVVVLTGAREEGIAVRFRALGVKPGNIFLNCKDKLKYLKEFCRDNGVRLEDVAYIGDDFPDAPVLKMVGKGIVPADASPEAAKAAEYMTTENGGEGCVRWVVKKILKEKGLWSFDPAQYEEVFGNKSE